MSMFTICLYDLSVLTRSLFRIQMEVDSRKNETKNEMTQTDIEIEVSQCDSH